MVTSAQPPAAASPALALLAERLRHGAGEVAGEIARAVTARVPEYGRLAGHDDEARRFRADIAALAALFPDLLVAGRSLSDGERAAVADVGERRARAGFTLDGAWQAVHAATAAGRRHLFAAWAEVGGADGSPETLEQAVGALAAFEFDLLRAFEAGFGRVDLEQRRDRDRAREAFVRELLHEPARDPTAIGHRARALEVDVTPPLGVVVVVEQSGGAGAFDDRVRRLVRRLPLPHAGSVVVGPEPEFPGFAVALLPDATRARVDGAGDGLAEACRECSLLAVHDVAPRLDQVPSTFRRLRALVPVVWRLGGRSGRVVAPDDLLLHRAAGALTPDEQEALLVSTLGPLMAVKRTAGDHVATIRALEAAGWRVSGAARRLHLSEEGVRERRVRIEHLTGLDLQCDRSRFVLAVRLVDLWADALPEPGNPWWSGGPEARGEFSLADRPALPETGETT